MLASIWLAFIVGLLLSPFGGETKDKRWPGAKAEKMPGPRVERRSFLRTKPFFLHSVKVEFHH